MKKFFLLAILSALTLSVFAQAKNDKTQPKVLVTYFSASGTTSSVAKLIAEVTGGKLFEIAPAQAYTSADLNWRDKQSRSTLEMSDKSSRPALKEKVADLEEYDVIYIGFPIWWNTAPRLINTFLESHDFGNKKVVPFATSGSSSIKGACNDLKTAYPKIKWEEGKLLNNAKKRDVEKWLSKKE